MRASLIIPMLPLFLSGALFAEETPVKVACQERWSNYFAEEAVTLHFSAEPPLTGVAAWRLATGDRTLARGERAIDTHGEGASQFTVQFALPPVKDGVMMPAEVTVSVQPTGDQSAYSTNQSLWIFSRHAFVDSVTWLESVDIHLFDPEDNTAKMLEASEIPFSPVHNPDALATVTNGIIIVGEGASFQEWRALSRLMIDAARRGHHVLCLAPAEGDWVLPLAFDAEQSKPRRCTLAGNEIIKRMDKRFDHTAWAGDGRMLSSTFELQGRRDIIAAIHANEEGDWSWIELDYGPKGGRVIVLGFAIMAKWNVSPTPRYLFRSILEHLTPNRNENPHLTTKGVPQ